MPKFLKKNKKQEFLKNNGQKLLKQNEAASARSGTASALGKMRNRILWQAGLAVMTIVLTIVIIFAMTAAWYTNIVQTSGLMFEAEAWGFDGTIQVNSDPIEAGPGDDGVIRLEVFNENENTTAVSVSISKARMAGEMQKRLYFYVDTQLARNGETMDRVYLNSQESYSYTLFSNGDLILTEALHNGAQLKWHWVYDVLGYYVLGTATGEDVVVSEYLRPIEYDYDQATIVTKTDETTNLVTMEVETVDGELSPEDFLVELSKNDGYLDQIKPEDKLESGYYPVAVDEETGYGVYAYLCSYSEIEMETQYDTALGIAAAKAADPEAEEQTQPILYEALLTISAQKNKNNVVNADSLLSLETAITYGAGDVIQLSSDITISGEDSLEIAQGQQIMLDLNGHTIKAETTGSAIEVNEGGSLTLTNGTLQGTEQSGSYAVRAVGAEVVLSNVDITGFVDALRIADDEGTQALDSKVRLVNCQVDASSYAIIIKGNGSTSAHNTQLILEGCTITSDVVGIGGNGSEDQSGTDIQILNSTVAGDPNLLSVGIFHPQKDGTLTIYKSEISGYTGLAIKGGSVSVTGSTVKGYGVQKSPGAYPSGCADTGDGIYIEANYGYPILLEIGGDSKIESIYGYSLQVYEPDAPNVTVRIYSGVFKEPQPDAYIAEGSEQTESTIKEKSTGEDSGTQ